MRVAVVTGGRDHSPTISEFLRMMDVLRARGIGTVRHGDCPDQVRNGARHFSVDQSVDRYLRARSSIAVEKWPARDHGDWPWCGPKRNRAMLDGDGHPDLFGTPKRPPASVLIAFKGGDGTADCIAAALERGIPVEWIPDADEPRPWNMHHGRPPEPSIYVGRSRRWGGPHVLANPYPVQVGPGRDRSDVAAGAMAAYRRWVWARLKPDSPHHDPRVVDVLRSITSDHHLGCTCWPHHCHVEVIIAAWRWSISESGA